MLVSPLTPRVLRHVLLQRLLLKGTLTAFGGLSLLKRECRAVVLVLNLFVKSEVKLFKQVVGLRGHFWVLFCHL